MPIIIGIFLNWEMEGLDPPPTDKQMSAFSIDQSEGAIIGNGQYWLITISQKKTNIGTTLILTLYVQN